MTWNTESYAQRIKNEYCEFFGVDDFWVSYSLDAPTITKTEVQYSMFGLYSDSQTVKFYSYNFYWKIKGETYRVTLDPIIKKYTHKRNVRYNLDEEAMKKLLLKYIKQSYKGEFDVA